MSKSKIRLFKKLKSKDIEILYYNKLSYLYYDKLLLKKCKGISTFKYLGDKRKIKREFNKINKLTKEILKNRAKFKYVRMVY